MKDGIEYTEKNGMFYMETSAKLRLVFTFLFWCS